MLPERLREYLISKGLTGHDVPKIATAFVTAKYATKASLVLLCIRYRPLSRLFGRAYRPMRERARMRLAREWERVKALDTRFAQQLRALPSRRARLAAWQETWRLKLRKQAEQQRERSVFYERLASWYRTQSAKKSELVAESKWFAAFARLMALEPRHLAIGTAEGLILGFGLAPLYYPVEFFLILRYYQRRNAQRGFVEEMKELRELEPWLEETDEE